MFIYKRRDNRKSWTQRAIQLSIACVVLLALIIVSSYQNTLRAKNDSEFREEQILQETSFRVISAIRDSLGHSLRTERCLILNDICLGCIDRFETQFIIETVTWADTSSVPFDLVIVGKLDMADLGMLASQVIGNRSPIVYVHNLDVSERFTVIWAEHIRSRAPKIVVGEPLSEVLVRNLALDEEK